MRLVPADINKVRKTGYKRTKNLELLLEFEESNLDCVEIVDYHHKSSSSCESSIANSIKNFGFDFIKVVVVDKRVYLIKLNPEEIK